MIIHEIVHAIHRNPHINRVIVCEREYEEIQREFETITTYTLTPRPTYGAPFGDIDRLLWDNLEALMKAAPIKILGRPVLKYKWTWAWG